MQRRLRTSSSLIPTMPTDSSRPEKQAALCEAAGIPVTLHSGGECGVSMAAYLHFAASVPNLILAEWFDTKPAY